MRIVASHREFEQKTFFIKEGEVSVFVWLSLCVSKEGGGGKRSNFKKNWYIFCISVEGGMSILKRKDGACGRNIMVRFLRKERWNTFSIVPVYFKFLIFFFFLNCSNNLLLLIPEKKQWIFGLFVHSNFEKKKKLISSWIFWKKLMSF